LISCSHSSPEGGRGAEVGRHGAMKPAGRALEGKDMGESGIRRSMRKRSMRGGHCGSPVAVIEQLPTSNLLSPLPNLTSEPAAHRLGSFHEPTARGLIRASFFRVE
jgi:hypothetical protein